MTMCHLWDTPDIELYFYEELDAVDTTRVAAHLRGCEDCRQRLEELRAIRRALAGPRVDAPPAGDWSGFMRRLDEACDLQPPTATPARRGSLRAVVAVAAMLALVTIGVIVASRVRPAVPASIAAPANSSPVAADVRPAGQPADPVVTTASRDKGLVELSEEHLERSKLVVLGLATRDPRSTVPADWEYERELAGSLLSDTRLFRLAAEDRGMKELARVMGDLETVLLQASLSDHAARDSLARVQRLITKRDLMVKMQVVGSTGI